MSDLTEHIQMYNPTHATAMLAFIEDDKLRATNEELNDFDCDIQEFDRCVVGEIHNWNDCYAFSDPEYPESEIELDNKYNDCFCIKCRTYANELSVLYHNNNRVQFASMLKDLYIHVSENHN